MSAWGTQRWGKYGGRGGDRGPGGSPIPGSATCWQGIILFWVLLQELWSYRLLGRDVEGVQESHIDTVWSVQRHLTDGMWLMIWWHRWVFLLVVLITCPEKFCMLFWTSQICCQHKQKYAGFHVNQRLLPCLPSKIWKWAKSAAVMAVRNGKPSFGFNGTGLRTADLTTAVNLHARTENELQ